MRSIPLFLVAFMLLLTSFRLSDASPKEAAVRCGSYLTIQNPTLGDLEPYIKKVTITRLSNNYAETHTIPGGTSSMLLSTIIHPGEQYRVDYQLMSAASTVNDGTLSMKTGSGSTLWSADYLEISGVIPTVSVTITADCSNINIYVSCEND